MSDDVRRPTASPAAVVGIRDVAQVLRRRPRCCAASISTCARGEVVTIIGPSGSGKTTLLRCVNFLESYDDGSHPASTASRSAIATSAGAAGAAASASWRAIRAETGMVFQMFNLFPHLTAAENVMLGLRKVRGKSKAEARAIAERWLDRVGLADKVDSLPAAALRRPAAARRHRPRRRHGAQDPAARRDHLGARPRAGRRGAGRRAQLADDGMTMIVVTHEMAFAREVSEPHRLHGRWRRQRRRPARRDPRPRAASNERLRTFLARFRASHF